MRSRLLACSLLGMAMLWPVAAQAQQGADQFGGQSRADAASTLIVLAVQQATGALPPMSGQAFSYEYDPGADTFVRSSRLGPTVLRTARPVGKGVFSARVAVSTFELDDSFGPATYAVALRDDPQREPIGYTKFGLAAKARVTIANVAMSYGITSWLDASLVIPVGVVDANAAQIATTPVQFASLPPDEMLVGGSPTVDELNGALNDGALVLRTDSFRDLGFSFNDGEHVGIGRIGLSARFALVKSPHFRLAFAPELLLPSPHEDELIGSESLAVVPRALIEVPVGGPLSFLADVGYDFDVDRPELRRFVGTGGVHLANERLSIDAGVSGAVYDQPVRWTPAVSYGAAVDTYPATVLLARDAITLGDDFVDFVSGMKIALGSHLAVSAAFSVPLNDQGFRPDALFTGGLEASF